MARPTESLFHPFCQQPAKCKHRINHSTIRTQLFQSCEGRIKLICSSCSYTQLRKTAADITCHVVPPTLLVIKRGYLLYKHREIQFRARLRNTKCAVRPCCWVVAGRSEASSTVSAPGILHRRPL